MRPWGWCERGDLNPHALRHWILSPARLPFRHARQVPPNFLTERAARLGPFWPEARAPNVGTTVSPPGRWPVFCYAARSVIEVYCAPRGRTVEEAYGVRNNQQR